MFPILYHAHHQRHLEDLPFWQRLAARQGGPLLELGCGTGRVLLPLAAALPVEPIEHVVGLDNDPDMLAVLRHGLAQASPELRSRVQILQADLTAFHLAQQFALILLPCNTLSTLDEAQRQALLERVAQHLAPKGLFAVSLPNPMLLRHIARTSALQVEESFPHPLEEVPVQVSSGWQRQGRVFRVQWVYEYTPSNSARLQQVKAEITHHLQAPQMYFQEAQRAGLHVFRTYGDYDASPYRREAPYLIMLMRLEKNVEAIRI